jgi:hypothetical protein
VKTAAFDIYDSTTLQDLLDDHMSAGMLNPVPVA